jgi:hypothetical protein
MPAIANCEGCGSFDQFLIHDLEMLLKYSNDKADSEDIFIPIIGDLSLHKNQVHSHPDTLYPNPVP